MAITRTTNESAAEHLASLLARCALERDPVRGRRLAEEYAEAFNAACVEAWGQRLAAKRMLLDAAECALDKAEATLDPVERRKHLQIFELFMGAARVNV
jgi:hypothetical protein